MSEIPRTNLFGKLNSLAYKAIEGATVFCKMRGNPYVELVHWLHQILNGPDSDLHRIIKHFNLDPSRVARDLTESLDKLPRGSTSISDLSSHIEEAVERGWVYGTLMFGEAQVRTGHLVVGILKTRGLAHALTSISKEFQKIKPDELAESFGKIVSGSPEDKLAATDGSTGGGAAPGEASGAMGSPQLGKQDALKKFTIDLTEQARTGAIDPIVGRDEEIRQIVDILMRRRQNNPILTGEAGVGKTAVVEGFAHRLAAGTVPPSLKDVRLLALDIGLLQAGASMKGEFEQRLRSVIEEVQASEKPIIMFVDEAHTLIGAGGAAGTGDAANLLKPALARGTLRTIAATTWAEYKKHIEKDPALTRRFQVVQVGEPNEEKAILMMRKMASVMEKHHKVQLLDEAIEAAVRLSHRYIPARQLPDKSVSLLDTACARVAISQHAVPAEVEDSRHRIEALETELEIIDRETAVGVETAARKAAVAEKLCEEKDRLAKLEARWKTERELVEKVLAARAKLRGDSGKVEGTASKLEKAADAAAAKAKTEKAAATVAVAEPLSEKERAAVLAELHTLQAQLHELQGEEPLILPTVDEQAVGSVVQDWTGIPVGRMVKNEIETVLKLPQILSERIIGQRHALEMIAKRIQTSRASLDNPNKPIGVFMLAGPSGVGKTETALTLAEALYGGEQNVITINMSEFQEAHTVSTLKGSPPGYVGYGEGGILTEAVRRRPYSVVLLDEVEKAHSDVHEMFFQVFDKGWMEDGEGRMIDFKNTLILLTTNAGTELIANMCKDPELMPDPEGLATALREPLLKVFPPALLGRIVTIPYYPLSDEMVGAITRLQLRRIEKRIRENHGIPFTYTDDVVKLIVSRCTELESGGRMIDAILTNSVLPSISQELLTRMMDGKSIARVHVTVDKGEFQYDFEQSAESTEVTMANSAKISLRGDILVAESSDLLKKAKDSRSDKLFKISPYQIRTEINLVSAGLSVELKTAVMKAAQKEADHFEDQLIKKVKELLPELEKLQIEDKRGNDKAGDTAAKKVKETSEEIDDTLGDFGPVIRKIVEKTIKKKLGSAARSVSTGGFRGLHLTAKFEHGGASAEVVKEYQEAAKSLDQSGEAAMVKGREDKKTVDGIKQSIKEQLAAVSKVTTKNDKEESKKFLDDVLPTTAKTLNKEFSDYLDKTEGFQDLLKKTGKTLEVEQRELSKDLATPEFRAKKDKFERVRRELDTLEKAVERRIKDTKQLADHFKDTDNIKQPRDWQLRLASINAQLARLDPINPEPFNKAAEQMLMESKRKA